MYPSCMVVDSPFIAYVPATLYHVMIPQPCICIYQITLYAMHTCTASYVITVRKSVLRVGFVNISVAIT